MPPEERKLLEDMLDAASRVQEFLHGKTVDQFASDVALRSAVYWQLMIVGEALSQLRQRNDDVIENISEWNRIIGFRNQIVHGYAIVDHETTWDITQQKVPILISELREILTSG